MTTKEVLEKYGMRTLEEYMAAKDGVVNMELMFYTDVLARTDHIPLKIFEKFIEGMAAASILEMPSVIIEFFKNVKITYADVLTLRKTAREKINEIQAGEE